MLKKDRNKLYCFSPPVMFATFAIEFLLAIYTTWRYKMSTTSRLATMMLFALGAFQFSEYMICGNSQMPNIDWVRFGYASIALLPALGIHMVVTLAGKKNMALIGAAYATCFAFVFFYLFNVDSISGQQCFANYAVFHTQQPISRLFGLYYYSWLAIGVSMAAYWGGKIPSRRPQLLSMMVGYLVFILPTAVVNTIDPTTIAGIPSIMCGFAVLLAITIVLRVLPKSCEVRDSASEVNESPQLKT